MSKTSFASILTTVALLSLICSLAILNPSRASTHSSVQHPIRVLRTWSAVFALGLLFDGALEWKRSKPLIQNHLIGKEDKRTLGTESDSLTG